MKEKSLDDLLESYPNNKNKKTYLNNKFNIGKSLVVGKMLETALTNRQNTHTHTYNNRVRKREKFKLFF